MSGHNPEVKDDFISFASDAKEIEEYILSHYGKEIYAVYGMSMGGVLTATLWQNNRLSFDKVIFDGSPLVSYNSFMKVSEYAKSVTSPVYIIGSKADRTLGESLQEKLSDCFENSELKIFNDITHENYFISEDVVKYINNVIQ